MASPITSSPIRTASSRVGSLRSGGGSQLLITQQWERALGSRSPASWSRLNQPGKVSRSGGIVPSRATWQMKRQVGIYASEGHTNAGGSVPPPQSGHTNAGGSVPPPQSGHRNGVQAGLTPSGPSTLVGKSASSGGVHAQAAPWCLPTAPCLAASTRSGSPKISMNPTAAAWSNASPSS